MNFYKLDERIKKEKLYIESVVSAKIRSLKDALEFIGKEGEANLSALINKKLSKQDWEVVKSAYRRAVKRWHPDISAKDLTSQQDAKDYTIGINFAYDKLNKAFENQTTIDSSTFNTINNNNEVWGVDYLKEKLYKKLKWQFSNININLETKENKIIANFEVSPENDPHIFEGLSVSNSFDPYFSVELISGLEEWIAKITLLNRANNQKLLDHTIKNQVKEQEVGLLAMLADYYDNIYIIRSFMEETISKAVNRSPMEEFARRLGRDGKEDVKAKGNKLVWNMKNTTQTRDIISDRKGLWPSMTVRKGEYMFDHPESKKYSSLLDDKIYSNKTFSPSTLTLSMQLFDDQMLVMLTDGILFKISLVEDMNKILRGDKSPTIDRKISTIIMNAPRKLLSAMMVEYQKYELETLKKRGELRGYHKDIYNSLPDTDSSVEVVKLAA